MRGPLRRRVGSRQRAVAAPASIKTGFQHSRYNHLFVDLRMVISLTQWGNNRAGTAYALVWRTAHGTEAQDAPMPLAHADISGRGGYWSRLAMARRHKKRKKRDCEPPHTVCPSVSMDNDQLIVVAAKAGHGTRQSFPETVADSAIGDK